MQERRKVVGETFVIKTRGLFSPYSSTDWKVTLIVAGIEKCSGPEVAPDVAKAMVRKIPDSAIKNGCTTVLGAAP